MILAIYICSLLLRSGCLGANPTIWDRNLYFDLKRLVHREGPDLKGGLAMKENGTRFGIAI